MTDEQGGKEAMILILHFPGCWLRQHEVCVPFYAWLSRRLARGQQMPPGFTPVFFSTFCCDWDFLDCHEEDELSNWFVLDRIGRILCGAFLGIYTHKSTVVALALRYAYHPDASRRHSHAVAMITCYICAPGGTTHLDMRNQIGIDGV